MDMIQSIAPWAMVGVVAWAFSNARGGGRREEPLLIIPIASAIAYAVYSLLMMTGSAL